MNPRLAILAGTATAMMGVAAVGASTMGFARTTPIAPANAPAAAEVQLDMATLHAAALSAARNARDTLDAPFLLVTVLGPGAMNATKQMPSASKHWMIKQDEAKGAAPLTTFSIAPGDSVRVLFTLLEADQVNTADESNASSALARLKLASGSNSAAKNSSAVASTLAPLTAKGTNLIGSAAMLLTNESGKAYWRSLDCVTTCSVSSSPVQASGSELATQSAAALSAIVELSGNKATYHLKVDAKRTK